MIEHAGRIPPIFFSKLSQICLYSFRRKTIWVQPNSIGENMSRITGKNSGFRGPTLDSRYRSLLKVSISRNPFHGDVKWRPRFI